MKKNRHFGWMAYLLCLSLGALCLGSCQKDFGDDNISDTSLYVGWEPSVTISGPTGWVSGKSNIYLTLDGSYSGSKITWKSNALDFRVISGQGTANLVCKFSSTQNPVVIAVIESPSSPSITVTAEGRIQLKILHSLKAPKLSGVGFNEGDYVFNNKPFSVSAESGISEVPVRLEWMVDDGYKTTNYWDLNTVTINSVTQPRFIYLYTFSCRNVFNNEIYSPWTKFSINVVFIDYFEPLLPPDIDDPTKPLPGGGGIRIE